MAGSERIVITGASGFIGSALAARLRAAGHRVDALGRSPQRSGDLRWDPEERSIDARGLEGVDRVVHLAGESIASSRWTETKKRRILDSRREGTALLAATLANLARPPRVLVSGSAVGFYGDRGDEVLGEESPPGSGFLADVCRAWEAAASPAAEAGIRVATIRTGVVLDRSGGALARMLPPFRLGAGGRFGSGRQWMSWVALEDAVRAIEFLLFHETAAGPVNLVSPYPVTNSEFTRVLGAALRRPTILPVPAPAVRLVFGEMGQALFLEGQRVLPARLRELGFTFRLPRLEEALRAILAG